MSGRVTRRVSLIWRVWVFAIGCVGRQADRQLVIERYSTRNYLSGIIE